MASVYIYHFPTVVDFSSEKYSDSTGHKNPGTSREINSEDADVETRTRNPLGYKPSALAIELTSSEKLLLGRS